MVTQESMGRNASMRLTESNLCVATWPNGPRDKFGKDIFHLLIKFSILKSNVKLVELN